MAFVLDALGRGAVKLVRTSGIFNKNCKEKLIPHEDEVPVC